MHNLQVSGTGQATGGFSTGSDIRFKTNIKQFKHKNKLNPVTYTHTKNNKQEIGFVANEVEIDYPELVITDNLTPEKYKYLDYGKLTAVLSSQVNELYDIIDELKQEIKQLKSKKK
jgi:hypothetical protein